jgi:hypothetical protein
MKTGRRAFIQKAGVVVGGGMLLGHHLPVLSKENNPSGQVRIMEPFHGAVLNWRHGERFGDGLKIKVQGEIPPGSEIMVNGVAAQREGSSFTSHILLTERETEITAMASNWFGQKRHSVRVLWDKHSFPRYRFAINNNIFFLRDIARKRYRSLLDCFYLDGLRKLHREYGTKFVLNIFYSDGLEYNNGKELLLTEFPDRYKKEWESNSHWLKLAFNAYSEFPDRPYQNAPAEKLIADLNLVKEQIYRFAGENSYSSPTAIHWVMIQPSALKPLAEEGVRSLSAYFLKTDKGLDLNLGLDETRTVYLSRNKMLKDFDSGIVFSRMDFTCNKTALNQTIPTLEGLVKDTRSAEIMNIFTHEQYFWPFYANYLPDHFQRLEQTIRWLTEKGYKPVFHHEGLLGAPE